MVMSIRLLDHRTLMRKRGYIGPGPISSTARRFLIHVAVEILKKMVTPELHFKNFQFCVHCNRGTNMCVCQSACKDICNVILGGELDGVSGCLMHERTKGHSFIDRSLASLSLQSVSQAAVQHWCGLFVVL